MTWKQRLVTIKNAVISGTMVLVKFTFAVPGAITRHLALPMADKLKVYQGWWTTIKKEAYHYWVRHNPSSHQLSFNDQCPSDIDEVLLSDSDNCCV